MIRDAILDEIWAERGRQETKWGGTHLWGVGSCASNLVAPSTKQMVLSEECGEVARAVLEKDPPKLRKELVQVAAVAIAWLESL